jgi:guanylate kinase|tara:strand:- start:863 stop:1438 length:576 start_codon:yes stop_codon:yes gene_type:complete
MDERNSNSKILIFSAPSGSGKTTLVKFLMQHLKNLSFSISATNRKKRIGEVDGKDYYFLSTDEFKRKIRSNDFIEWEEVYKDNFYGTLKSEISRIQKSGRIVVFDVDVVGGVNLKKLFGNKALGIFVMPPSLEVLGERLGARRTDKANDIDIRLKKAESELKFSDRFDKIIVNDDLERAKKETIEIVEEFI